MSAAPRPRWQLYDMANNAALSAPATKTATIAALRQMVDEWRGRGDKFTARKDAQIGSYVKDYRRIHGEFREVDVPVKDGPEVRHFKCRGVWARSVSMRQVPT